MVLVLHTRAPELLRQIGPRQHGVELRKQVTLQHQPRNEQLPDRVAREVSVVVQDEVVHEKLLAVQVGALAPDGDEVSLEQELLDL